MPQIIPPRIPIIRIHIQILHRTPHARLNTTLATFTLKIEVGVGEYLNNLRMPSKHVHDSRPRQTPKHRPRVLTHNPPRILHHPLLYRQLCHPLHHPCKHIQIHLPSISDQGKCGVIVPVVRRQSRCQRCNTLRRDRR